MKKLTGVAVVMMVAGFAGCGATASTSSTDVAAAPALGSASTGLVHCYDANICGGHNDCKTAANACAGQGFVAMPAKSCADVGGKVA
jgi:hypothetical protein